MKATANATRQGGWWAIEVPEIPGLFTQARRLDQVAEMVTDAAATLGHEVEEVEVVPVLPAGQDAVDAAKRSRLVLQDAERAASAANREAVGALLAAGLTVRDAAVLMGVSPQRISAIGQSGGARVAAGRKP